MLSIHCHAWKCLSNATLEFTSPAKRLPLKTVNKRNYFLSTQSLTFTLTENQWTLIKLKNTKKTWSTKYQRINTQLMNTKSNQRLRYTWRTLLKLKNTKCWSWQNTKKTWTLQKNCTTILWRSTKHMNVTKFKNKLNMMEHKTDMNITEKLSNTFMKER